MIVKSGNTVLCAGYGRPVVGGPGVMVGPFLPDSTRQKQVQDYVRSDEVDVFDRGNTTTEVPFNVARQHATPAQAQLFRAAHIDALNGTQGAWTIQPEGPEDGIAGTLQITGVLEVKFPEHPLNKGVSTLAAYKITGGRLKKL